MGNQSDLAQHIHNIIFKNYTISPDTFVLLVYDTKCELARVLKEAIVAQLS